MKWMWRDAGCLPGVALPVGWSRDRSTLRACRRAGDDTCGPEVLWRRNFTFHKIPRTPTTEDALFRSIGFPVRRAGLAVLCASALTAAPASGMERIIPRATSDSADAAQTVSRFHAALASGDSITATRLLAPDARILESGEVQNREEYRRHHLPADIAFSRGVPSTRTVVSVVVAGDAAWVSSTSETKGTFNGRTVNSVGAELMVLTRDPHAVQTGAADAQRWVIRAIHWSSHRGKP